MKKKIILMLGLIGVTPMIMHAQEFSIGPTMQLKGALIATDAIDHHSYVIHCNGQQTRSNKDGFYTLLPDTLKEVSTMSILICRTFLPKFGKANSIKELVSHPERYRYFVLSKNSNYPTIQNPEKSKKLKPEEGFWNIKEEKLHTNFIIPENCVSILIDPKFFKGIENWPIRLESNVIPLPRILLKNKKEMIQDKPSRAQTKGYIREASFWSDSNAALSSPFHRKVNVAKRTNEQGKTKNQTDAAFID